MDSAPQRLIALPTQMDLVDLAGLIADRSGSGITAQAIRIWKKSSIVPDFAEQPWRHFRSGSGQRAEEIVIRVACEEFLDAFAILLQLLFQNDQTFNHAQNQEALGALDGRRYLPLAGFAKGRDAALIGIFAIELVAMKERVPFFGTCSGQSLRCWEAFQELQSGRY